jgi:hypothetical protein
MEGGEQLGRRLSFLDSGVTEGEEEDDNDDDEEKESVSALCPSNFLSHLVR